MSDLHNRVAKALGWPVEETKRLSMQSLRDLVRPVDPDLAQELSYAIQSGAYIRGEPLKKPRRHHAEILGSGPKIPTFKIAGTAPATMTASQINKELDKLSAQNSQLGQLMIDAGRGYERPSEYLKMSDPLSMELRKNADRRMALRIEIEFRYGPGSPSRLPTGRGFGPRK